MHGTRTRAGKMVVADESLWALEAPQKYELLIRWQQKNPNELNLSIETIKMIDGREISRWISSEMFRKVFLLNQFLVQF